MENIIEKIITNLHQLKEEFEPKRRKKIINLIKTLQDILIDEAQAYTGQAVKDHIVAIEILTRKLNDKE